MVEHCAVVRLHSRKDLLEQISLSSLNTPNRKDRAMEQTQQNNGEPLEPPQAAAKAALLAECDRLTAAGVTFVTVHFDGYGDDGTTEEVKCYDGEWYASGEREPEPEPVKYDASHLQEHFEALVPFGYENDCGGFGDVVLNVSARKLTVERNDRFEDYTTTTYEV